MIKIDLTKVLVTNEEPYEAILQSALTNNEITLKNVWQNNVTELVYDLQTAEQKRQNVKLNTIEQKQQFMKTWTLNQPTITLSI